MGLQTYVWSHEVQCAQASDRALHVPIDGQPKVCKNERKTTFKNEALHGRSKVCTREGGFSLGWL